MRIMQLGHPSNLYSFIHYNIIKMSITTEVKDDFTMK